MQFKLGELFCGAGGLAWGAINAGRSDSIQQNGETFSIGHAWACDLDLSACHSFAANIVHDTTDLEVIERNVVNISTLAERPYQAVLDAPIVLCEDAKYLSQHLDLLPKIDAFAFGFPCNDFSSVGERKGLDGDFGPLYSHGISVINFLKPRWFVAENVEGLLRRDGGKAFDQIISELEEAGEGYVLTPHLYRFEEYGVPQTRTRLVIVGICKADDEDGIRFRVPAPTTLAPYRSAEWSMMHEATSPEVEKPIAFDAPNHKMPRLTDRVRMRLEHTRPGQNAWTATIPKEYALNVKKARMSMIYRRLVADEPSYTITGNGGGGTRGYHWAEPRALTNRERARLQSFPDNFVFFGKEESIRRQIGMAVPPVAAQIIFEAILKTYAGMDYEVAGASLKTPQRWRINQLHRC